MPRPRSLRFLITQLSRREANQSSTTTSSALPEPLETLLPPCSKFCLRSFIADNYPSSSSNIHTLCSFESASGFTLGEAALICESAYCAADDQVYKSIFSICASIPQAIRPSHQVLTVVPMATSQLAPGSDAFSSALAPSISIPAVTSASSTGITTDTGAPSIPSPSTSAPASSTPSTTLSPSSSFSGQPPSGTSSTPTFSTITKSGELGPAITSGSPSNVASPTPQAQGNLNTGQIVGISLASLAVLGFIIGLLLCWYHRQRKPSRTRQGSRWSDGFDKQPPSSFSPTQPHLEDGLPNARAQTPDHSQRFYAPPTTNQEKRRSFWRRSVKPEDIGVALSPEVVQAGSPTSMSSQRTMSQLLPEFPNCSISPAPLTRSHQIPVSPESYREVTRPNVTFPSTFVESRNPNRPLRIISARTGSGLPGGPRSQMYKLDQVKGAHNRIPPAPVYDNGNVSTTFGAILAPNENTLVDVGYSSQLHSQRTCDAHLPRIPRISQAPEAAKTSTLSASNPGYFQATSWRPAPPLRRSSSASDTTSFEDDEDTTPEQEHDRQLRPIRLSPVLESPQHFPHPPVELPSNPLKELMYPSPPRSAAISKQAENQPRPRAAQFVDTLNTTNQPMQRFVPAAHSRRDQLVLQERSFLSSTSSSSPSSKRERSPSWLLAKRRGDRAADQMFQHGLKLSPMAANAPRVDTWQLSDLTEECGGIGSDTENRVNVVLKTPPAKGGVKTPPVWTPRLTPTKQGEDLYLRVE